MPETNPNELQETERIFTCANCHKEKKNDEGEWRFWNIEQENKPEDIDKKRNHYREINSYQEIGGRDFIWRCWDCIKRKKANTKRKGEKAKLNRTNLTTRMAKVEKKQKKSRDDINDLQVIVTVDDERSHEPRARQKAKVEKNFQKKKLEKVQDDFIACPSSSSRLLTSTKGEKKPRWRFKLFPLTTSEKQKIKDTNSYQELKQVCQEINERRAFLTPLLWLSFFTTIYFGWNKFWAWYQKPLDKERDWDDEEEVKAVEPKTPQAKSWWGWIKSNKIRIASLIGIICALLSLGIKMGKLMFNYN